MLSKQTGLDCFYGVFILFLRKNVVFHKQNNSVTGMERHEGE